MRWTCAEFHRFGDLGVFEGRRAMLIDGVILEEGPMNPPHAITLELVEESLRTAFGRGWRIRSQSPLVLGHDLDPEPDFAPALVTPSPSRTPLPFSFPLDRRRRLGGHVVDHPVDSAHLVDEGVHQLGALPDSVATWHGLRS